jgi:CheY-like chemotaxis protein
MLGQDPVSAAREAPLVLVVEDDPETRQLYVALFAAAGYRIDSAHNGFQALEKVAQSPPDLILTDIAVPGIDGIELCRRLRSDRRTRHIPLLAVTGYDDRAYPDRVLQAGADRVLLKPMDPEILLNEARALLQTTRAQSTAPQHP